MHTPPINMAVTNLFIADPPGIRTKRQARRPRFSYVCTSLASRFRKDFRSRGTAQTDAKSRRGLRLGTGCPWEQRGINRRSHAFAALPHKAESKIPLNLIFRRVLNGCNSQQHFLFAARPTGRLSTASPNFFVLPDGRRKHVTRATEPACCCRRAQP